MGLYSLYEIEEASRESRNCNGLRRVNSYYARLSTIFFIPYIIICLRIDKLLLPYNRLPVMLHV